MIQPKALEGEMGLFAYDLENAPCKPGKFRVRMWALDYPYIEIPILDLMEEDRAASRVLVYMYDRAHPNSGYLHEWPGQIKHNTGSRPALQWIGVSLRRILWDAERDPAHCKENPERIREVLDDLSKKGYFEVQGEDLDKVFYPTLKLIMVMIAGRDEYDGLPWVEKFRQERELKKARARGNSFSHT